MANTITAGNGTNNGLAVTSDATGTLNILTGSGAGTAAISIDASQNVTMAADAAVTGDLAVTGNTTITGTLSATGGVTGSLTSATAQASTSGTSIDFTSIPAGVKRITVMLSGVSTNGTSNLQIQIGAGSITNTGYTSVALYCQQGVAPTVTNSTTGFLVTPVSSAAEVISGTVVFTWLSANIWTCFGSVCDTASTNNVDVCSGSLSLGGSLDRVRITTVNGTDTFDAGTINIIYE